VCVERASGGMERAGTVRKLCLVHSIIASGHGEGEKIKNALPGFGIFLSLANFLLGQRSVSPRERERASLVFLFISIITPTFFLFLALPFFHGANHVSQASATDSCLAPPLVIANLPTTLPF
jgi:hypothetical protein